MPTDVFYEAVPNGQKHTSADIVKQRDKTISRQIDELVRIAKTERNKEYGADFFREVKEYYNVTEDPSAFPSFRPRVSIPQMQTLVLNEATDITDSSPKVALSFGDGRDKDRERYFQANWRANYYNNRLLEAVIWSLYTNLGFLQVGFDPMARHGKGLTWVHSRNPAMTYVDPYARADSAYSFIVLQDWMYIDEVKWRWPMTAWAVKPRYVSDVEPGQMADVSLDYPEMSPLNMHGTSPSQRIFRDNRVLVQQCFCFDNARQRIKDYVGTSNIAADLVAEPRWEYKYPDGRWIVECEGVILSDGNNWMPQLPEDDRGTFPLVRIQATPALHNIFGPPPIRFTRSLQALSEQLYSQLYENCHRLNNGVIVIKSNTGLIASDIGWLPGEILTINPQSDPPQVIAPVAFPQHMLTVPQTLLAMQKELMGYGGVRQGESQPGNISAELFDASLWQQQGMTRMRCRLLSEPLQRLAEMIFFVMARYMTSSDRRIDPSGQGGGQGYVKWQPTNAWADYEVEFDQDSLKMLSGAGLRSVIAALAKANMIPTEQVLEAFGVPNAAQLAEEKMRELELGAVQRLRRAR
jgi:hypothetical protein